MLSRAASTSGTLQPSLALQAGVPVDAVRPPSWAAALANLRAEQLLRFIDTILRHMPRGQESLAGRDLLEALLSALKPHAGRDGENGRRLSELFSRLPADLRPAAEKLIATALSLLPTRDLAAVLRNPDSAEAQRLATLIAARLAAGAEADAPPAGTERPQRIAGLTVQQLAAVSRHGVPAEELPASETRSRQAALRRIFEPDGSRPQPSSDRAANLAAPPPARPERMERQAAAGLPAVHGDEASEEPAVANVMQAVVRRAPPDMLVQTLATLVAGLGEEEVQIIRALLQRPLEETAEPAVSAGGVPDEDGDGAAAPDNGREPVRAGPARRDGEAAPAAGARPAAPAAEPQAQARIPADVVRTAAPAETIAAAALPSREGVPLAFVPYLTAEDDVDWREAEKSEGEEKTADEEQQDQRGETGEDGSEAAGPDAETPESPDMAARRRNTADILDAPQPGFVFNDRPGHYWT